MQVLPGAGHLVLLACLHAHCPPVRAYCTAHAGTGVLMVQAHQQHAPATSPCMQCLLHPNPASVQPVYPGLRCSRPARIILGMLCRRLCLRFLPVDVVCAANLEEIRRGAKRVCTDAFPGDGPGIKFAVQYEHRASAAIKRGELIDAVVEAVPKVSPVQRDSCMHAAPA